MPIFRACKHAKFALQHPIILDVFASPWTTLKTEKRKFVFSWEMKSVSGHLKVVESQKSAKRKLSPGRRQGVQRHYYRVGSHLLNFQLVKMKLFRASQSSVVHIEAVLTSNQSPVWPAKIFQRFIDTEVCKRCLSQFIIHQSTSCAKNHTKAVLCSDISIVSCRTTL